MRQTHMHIAQAHALNPNGSHMPLEHFNSLVNEAQITLLFVRFLINFVHQIYLTHQIYLSNKLKSV